MKLTRRWGVRRNRQDKTIRAGQRLDDGPGEPPALPSGFGIGSVPGLWPAARTAKRARNAVRGSRRTSAGVTSRLLGYRVRKYVVPPWTGPDGPLPKVTRT